MKRAAITDLFFLADMKLQIIAVASNLSTDTMYSREDAVKDLLKVAEELTGEEKGIFSILQNEKSPTQDLGRDA